MLPFDAHTSDFDKFFHDGVHVVYSPKVTLNDTQIDMTQEIDPEVYDEVESKEVFFYGVLEVNQAGSYQMPISYHQDTYESEPAGDGMMRETGAWPIPYRVLWARPRY